MRPRHSGLEFFCLPRRLISVALLAVGCLTGCAERGDFDRPRATALSRLITPLDGPSNSGFPYTDDEEELRNRAWRFLMPAKERWFVDGVIHEAARSGYLPQSYFPETLTWYHEALMGEAFRSPASRFSQIASDVSADRQLLSVFVQIAARVVRADQSRARAIPAVSDLTVAEWRDADLRMQENRALIGWVCYRASMRLRAYRYALEHAYVAMPQIESVRTERVLLAYENDFEPLRAIGCIRDNPWRGLALHRGLRIPRDGYFFADEGGAVRAVPPPAPAVPVAPIRKS